MFQLIWSSALAIASVLMISLALRFLGARWARGPEAGRRARRLAAVRLLLLVLVLVGALARLITATSGLAAPLRSAVIGVAVLCALPWVVNALAGLWLLSPFLGARLGDAIVACGHRGHIVGYGATRLELETDAGWRAYLPYVAVAWRPVLLNEAGRARGTELRIQRADWTEDELELVREAAILAPYRDLSSAVSITRRANVVSVHLTLSRPGSEARMRRFLDAALARPRSTSSVARRESLAPSDPSG